MATAPFTNILPDPSNHINITGQAGTGTGFNSGPGFASFKLNSQFKTSYNTTNSGRTITSSSGGHKWSLAIEYNPLTRDEFEPVYNFLGSKQGRLEHFFVQMPETNLRSVPFRNFIGASNDTFYVYTSPVTAQLLELHREYKIKESSTQWVSAGAATGSTSVGDTFIATGQSAVGTHLAAPTYEKAGQDNLTIANELTGYSLTTHQTPRPGDLFTISDPSDSSHTKLYKINKVETSTDNANAIQNQYDKSEPASTTVTGTDTVSPCIRIHFTPELQKNVYAGAVIKFSNPMIRVRMTQDVQEYSLNTENLYSFSLQLEEAQK